jgi:hypothetical protein
MTFARDSSNFHLKLIREVHSFDIMLSVREKTTKGYQVRVQIIEIINIPKTQQTYDIRTLPSFASMVDLGPPFSLANPQFKARTARSNPGKGETGSEAANYNNPHAPRKPYMICKAEVVSIWSLTIE